MLKLILSIGLFISAFHFQTILQEWYRVNSIEQIQENIQAKLSEVASTFDFLQSQSKFDPSNLDIVFKDSYSNEVYYFLYEDEKLLHWSDDHVAFNTLDLASNAQLLNLANGKYLKVEEEIDNRRYLALILLKNEFVHQNPYLQNSYSAIFNVPFKQCFINSSAGDPILDSNGNLLFYIDLQSINGSSLVILFWQIALFILSLLLLRSTFLSFSNRNGELLFASLLLFVWVFLLFKKPVNWIEWDLFDPQFFIVFTWLPSLGDFTIGAISVFYLVMALSPKLKIDSFVWRAVFGILILCFIQLTVLTIKTGLINSTIPFQFTDFLNLEAYSWIALISYSALFFSCIVLLNSLLSKSNKTGIRWFLYLVFLLGPLVFHELNIIVLLSPLSLLSPVLLLIGIDFYTNSKKPTLSIMLLLLVVSYVHAVELNAAIEWKEEVQLQAMAEELAKENDPIAEYLFYEVDSIIKTDSFLLSELGKYSTKKTIIDEYLSQQYFNGYFGKYTTFFTLCTRTDSLYFNGNNAIPCLGYFISKLDSSRQLNEGIFLLKGYSEGLDYLGIIQLPNGEKTYYLFVELTLSILNANQGYPELLMDEKNILQKFDFSNLSYAVYRNKKLAYKNGEFSYSSTLSFPELSVGSFYSFSAEGHQQLIYLKNNSTAIQLSQKLNNKEDWLNSITYLLLFYGLLLVVLNIIFKDFPIRLNWEMSDFSSRVQVFLVSSLLFAVLLFSLSTIYYISKQNQEKNIKNIAEKIRSINIELENKIGGEEQLSDSIQSYVAATLVKFSNVFYSDINLYDTSGFLYASSRPEIYYKGLKSNRMNPNAKIALLNKQKAECLQSEKIGELEFLSAYIPFTNDKNKVLAYLNLPYFAKQGDLEKEISRFLVSTINIYVAIFVLALLISILLINQISRPLLMIRKQLRDVKLGDDLELLEWDSKDEIGALVQEYNRMVLELNESANRLAQSEREGAWREMAKQVAHEIKNPLTPMKLSIQHLQMAYEKGADDIDERVKKTTQTLIEQIDTLSTIATEFSSFAKMPAQQLENLELVKLIERVVDLFKADNDIEFQLNLPEQEVLIIGDRNQIIRVMSNLIKNSIQAKKENQTLIIEVSLSLEKEGFCKFFLKDNGAGIPSEQMNKIFEPSFTTKSGGTGLGLAMVQNIIKGHKGKVNITSDLGEGTLVTIEFPLKPIESL